MHDHEPFGLLTVENIITKSSNIGAAKIGIRLGEEQTVRIHPEIRFRHAHRAFRCPAEVGGTVHPVKDWSKVSIAQIPMGQGVTVTPLQMVMAMSAIANKGLLMRPMLVDRLEDPDGKLVVKYKPQPVRQVASLETIKEMVTALKTVVTRDGTAVQGAPGPLHRRRQNRHGGKSRARAVCAKIFFLVHRLFSGGQSGALHFRGHGRTAGTAIMAAWWRRRFSMPSPNAPRII